jgi:tetratricopeptide (TPR) repeat protein
VACTTAVLVALLAGTDRPQAGLADAESEVVRADALFERARYREAVKSYEKARDLDPALTVQVTRFMVRALLRVGDFHVAAGEGAILTAQSEDPGDLALHGDALWSVGHFDEAELRYRAALDISSAIQVLLLDTTNPRSLAYQVLELAQRLDALPREGGVRRGLALDQRALLQASTLVRLADAPHLLKADAAAPHQRAELAAFLAAVDSELSAATAALDQAYFTHVQPTQQLVAVTRDLDDHLPETD